MLAGAFLASRCYPCQQCVSLPAGAFFVRSCFPMALRHCVHASSTSLVLRPSLPIGPLLATCSSAPRLLLPINALAGNLHIGAPAGNLYIGAPAGNLYIGAPASNKPHLAEKSTPVWLAILHIWAGFANSQLLPDAAALSSMQGLPWSGNSSAQTSASLHPPAALRLRVLPFTRTWSSTVCAEEFPTPLEMSLHGLPLLRHSKSFGPSAPIAYATSVSPPDETAAWPGTQVLRAG